MAHQRVYFLEDNGIGEAVFAARVVKNLYRLEGTPGRIHNEFEGVGFGDIVLVEKKRDSFSRGVLAVKRVALKSGLIHSYWRATPDSLRVRDVRLLEDNLDRISPAYAQLLINQHSVIPYAVELSCAPGQFARVAALLSEYDFDQID